MGELRLAPVARGLLTYFPALNDLVPQKNSVGHTDSARYCYNLWLRHLTLLGAHGMSSIPRAVAELGPGESIGVGLCALLSGANRYAGLDVAAFSNPERNQRILNELIPLFQERAGYSDKGWPDISPYLDARSFPNHLLSEEALRAALQFHRLAQIRNAISEPSVGNPIVAEYCAPWSDPRVVEENSVDLIISHSVLEHVVDLPGTYRALYQWLKPGGWMSHQIDLKSHGVTRRWNGFRACSERMWSVAVGRRPYMINRQPASAHLRLMQEAGFRLVTHQKFTRLDGIGRDELAPRWSDISDEDLNCSGVYVIATK
jgi:hypothetical protein